MSLRDVSLYLMETLKCWSSRHEYIVVFMFLVMVSKGSACEAPSSPECFRRKAVANVYICEWSMNTTERNVTFDLYFNKTKFRSPTKTCNLNEEQLRITRHAVYIWVEARVGNSSCMSPRRSVVLGHTVKYEAPQNIFMSWFENNLNLKWIAAEQYPALAEIRFRRIGNPTESWGKLQRTTNTTRNPYTCHVIVANLLKDSVYQVQIRHQSTQALNPLWSDWSPVVTVPAELKPEVTMKRLNGTRKVTVTWKPMPNAAAVTGVSYILTNTQSSQGCPCKEKRNPNTSKHITTYVSLSAVNITVTARSAAGHFPPAIVQIPAEPAADLKICDKTLLDKELKRQTCLEWYQLQDGDSRPENVITLTGRDTKKDRKLKRMNIKDYVLYLYFEHRCDSDGKPKTDKMCLFYQKEGAPLREPQELIAFSEKHTSADLSWKAIPSVDQRGFLTHYVICSVKVSSQDELKECRNISASLTKHRLENLTPGTKYNISLLGVTRAGEGPQATLAINTLPEKSVNVWWSLALLCLFFLLTTMCTCILKRIKNKIFPPVPTPIIPDFISYQPESKEFQERKEEVDQLTLHQHPEDKSVPEDAEETTVLTGEWDEGTDEDVDDRVDSRMSGGTSDECPSSTDEALRSSREGEMTDLEQVDNEIAMLIYRNGLVFDVKTDSP